MKITDAIRGALRQYLEEHGMSCRALAAFLKINPHTPTRWLSPASGVRDISPANWVKLRPLLLPYLPESYRRHTPVIEARPAVPGDFGPPVPLIGFAQAAGYEAALQPLDDFIADIGDEHVIFPQSREGDIALRVDGDSMLPWYPPGTILLVRPGEFPERGDIVVAKLYTGDIVCKRYGRRNSIITLEALNPDGVTYTWNTKTEPGKVLWMWPVVASIRDERRIRWEAVKNGDS